MMDIQKNNPDLKELINEMHDVTGTWSVADMVTHVWQRAQKVAVPDGFVLVPKTDVHDHYVAEHLKDTTCSVDVSELTGNFGDRIYGKLRPYDCIGSDGNTLLYDLESSNFNMQRHAGNSGDYVLVPKEPTLEMLDAGCKSITYSMTNAENSSRIYKAMVEAAENKENL